MRWILFAPMMLSLLAIICVLSVMYVVSTLQARWIRFFQTRAGSARGNGRCQRDNQIAQNVSGFICGAARCDIPADSSIRARASTGHPQFIESRDPNRQLIFKPAGRYDAGRGLLLDHPTNLTCADGARRIKKAY